MSIIRKTIDNALVIIWDKLKNIRVLFIFSKPPNYVEAFLQIGKFRGMLKFLYCFFIEES